MVARYTALVAATEIWPTPPAMEFRVPPKEVGHTAAEDGQRQAGDVLVGPEGDGQETVQQTAQGGGGERRQQRDHQTHETGGIGIVELIEEGGRQSRNTAQIHDPGDAQVQVAGFLCQDLAHGAEQNDGAELDSRLNQLNNLVDAHLAPPFRPADDAVVDEKFAAQNEEQDDARNDIGGVVIQVELGGDLNGALLQKHQQEGDQDHHKGVELSQPSHDDGGEATSPAVEVEMVWLAPATAMKPARPQMRRR